MSLLFSLGEIETILHFGANNDPNGFNSKFFSVFGIPIILLIIHLLGSVLSAKDPRKQNISNKMFTLVLWIVPFISILIAVFSYSYNMGMDVNIALFGNIFTGLLFVVVGNYLPKIRQNYTMGIKIPWTLANEENWNKTHRMPGIIWIIIGIFIMLTSFIKSINGIWIVVGAVIALIVPSIYSFFLHTEKGL